MAHAFAGTIDRKLVTEILENPLDDAPRLVLADVLQAKHDPRGEFIVMQCRLAEKTTARSERETLRRETGRMLHELGKKWAGDAAVISDRVFRRGFMDEIDVDVKQLTPLAKDLFSSEPITRLILNGANTKNLGPLADEGAFHRILRLVVRGNVGNAGARVLAGALAKRKFPLSALNIGGAGIESDGIASLVDVLEGCTSLSLTGNDIGDEGLQAIANAKTLTKLESLFITANEVSDDGLIALAESPNLGSLAKITVARNEEVTEDGLGALAHSKTLKGLRWLEYSDEDGEQHIATRNR